MNSIKKVGSFKKLLQIIEESNFKKPMLVWFKSNSVLDCFKRELMREVRDIHQIVEPAENVADAPLLLCHRYIDQMNKGLLEFCVSLSKSGKRRILYFANEYEHRNCPAFVSQEFEQVELNVRSAIVLNHMFTGDYLNDNIGHEIVNLFSSDDNGKHYIYLCDDGEFNREDILVEHVVQVRRPSRTTDTLEIINIASGLTVCTDADPEYGGARLSQIFKNNKEQQTRNVTFVATKISKPSVPLFIWTTKDAADTQNNANLVGVTINNYSPSRNLREYIYEELDDNGRTRTDSNYFKLKQLITGFSTTKKCSLPRVDLECKTIASPAEIYGVLGRELSYSDAFSYFINKHPEWFWEFCTSKGFVSGADKFVSVHREWKNVDLLVKYKKHWIVIENKIFSGLNGKNGTQLTEYRNKIESEIAENEEIDSSNVSYILLQPDHNNISQKEWPTVKYSEVYKFLQDKHTKSKDDELNGFLLSLEPHTAVDFNFHIMQKRFVRAIKKAKKLI